ncbi:hypothetical protein SASPL_103181 [Salvia splendens]|uniref:Uncharacterized protein n=1 Tax=Salvia splendens TaxID=180675 RepID=A0A8X8YTX4_SALSN|nr:uncharacterized protein LOC121792622 [Salvia splendens]KAG6438244.1 hypothetical protein SASPL_103181 [Salvia splendens]
MGICISSNSISASAPSATVIAATGELIRLPLPATASEALQSLNSPPNSFFLCSSDRLYFDDFIPPLSPADRLEAGQIYFALPVAKLRYRLAAPEMAALAVKASAAMDQIGRRKKKARISPAAAAEEEDPQSNHSVTYRKSFGGGEKKAAAVSRSGSLRKLGRYSSRRAMQAVRSFKNKLSTINEA